MSSPAHGEDDPNPSSAGLHYWGSTPTEDEYYASHGVRGTQAHFTSPRGVTLFARSWEPLPSSPPPRGVVCMVHGYGNDVSWTFQETPIYLASRGGFACFAPDLEGHGQSSGLRAFVPDVPAAASDVAAYFRHVLSSRPDLQGLPRFLYGESMGGAICLLLHLQQKDNGGGGGDDDIPWTGAVLVAPMCKIADSLRPPWPLPQLLILAARFAPTLACVPTADLLDKSVKVPAKRAVAGRNPRRYAGKPRLGTVVELLRVTDSLHARLAEVELPFLVVHGSADAVTDPAVSEELYEAARSADKTIRIYDGMMHSLLFGETDDNVELVRGEILAWLEKRCGARTVVIE